MLKENEPAALYVLHGDHILECSETMGLEVLYEYAHNFLNNR